MTGSEDQNRLSLRERLRGRLGDRALATGLTLLIEAVFLLAVLSLGWTPDEQKKLPGTNLVSVSFKPSNDDQPQAQKDRPEQAQRSVQQPQKQSAPQQAASNPAPVPAAAPSPPPPAAIIPVSSNQMAALDISRLPRQGGATGPQAKTFGPAFTPLAGDSKRVGTAPNGSPLYAAQWYREPYDDELAGYLSTAQGPGWGLIACRTAPDWRVEDCVVLDESPSGSGVARAAKEAAWQFKVRPPRLGGVYKVGEWVRIRIDYGIRPRA